MLGHQKTSNLSNTLYHSGLLRSRARANMHATSTLSNPACIPATHFCIYIKKKRSNVKQMSNMFAGASNFSKDISKWDTGAVQNIQGLFDGATNFNIAIGDWNVSRVIHVDRMFFGATSFQQNLGRWTFPETFATGPHMDHIFGVECSDHDSDLEPASNAEYGCGHTPACKWDPPAVDEMDDRVSLGRLYCLEGMLKKKDGEYCTEANVDDVYGQCDSGRCQGSRCCNYDSAKIAEASEACSACTKVGRCYSRLTLSDGWKNKTQHDGGRLYDRVNDESSYFQSTSDVVSGADHSIPSNALGLGEYFQVNWIGKMNTKDAVGRGLRKERISLAQIAGIQPGLTDLHRPSIMQTDVFFELRWLRTDIASNVEYMDQNVNRSLQVGLNPPIEIDAGNTSAASIWTTDDPCSTPGGIGIDSSTGTIFAKPEKAGSYLGWIVAVDRVGTALQQGVPAEMDEVLLQAWKLSILPRKTFEITTVDYAGSCCTVDGKDYDPLSKFKSGVNRGDHGTSSLDLAGGAGDGGDARPALLPPSGGRPSGLGGGRRRRTGDTIATTQRGGGAGGGPNSATTGHDADKPNRVQCFYDEPCTVKPVKAIEYSPQYNEGSGTDTGDTDPLCDVLDEGKSSKAKAEPTKSIVCDNIADTCSYVIDLGSGDSISISTAYSAVSISCGLPEDSVFADPTNSLSSGNQNYYNPAFCRDARPKFLTEESTGQISASWTTSDEPPACAPPPSTFNPPEHSAECYFELWARASQLNCSSCAQPSEKIATFILAYAESPVAIAAKRDARILKGVGACFGVAVLAIIAYKYRERQIRLRPVNFQDQLKRMIASGEIAPDQALGTNSPRELRRKDLVLVKVVGSGAFGEVHKMFLFSVIDRSFFFVPWHLFFSFLGFFKSAR